MAASIEALFMVLGPDEPEIRRSNISTDKFYQAKCSYKKTQLGLTINTRTMLVSLPPKKMYEILQLLRHWHAQRKSFVIKESATLLGKLENTATVAEWARFLFLSLRHAILLALRTNTKHVYAKKSFKHFIAHAHELPCDDFSLLRKKFALSKIAKAIWNSKEKAFITKELRKELILIESILKNSQIRWATPISHMVARDPDFQSWGDSSLTHAGGFPMI